MTNIKLIGIGHKARQGKDTLATFLKKELEKLRVPTLIVHWADPLKDEVANHERLFPLIQRTADQQKVTWYKLLNKRSDGSYYYDLFRFDQFPELHKFMLDRDLMHYMGMSEKDSPLLQLWGTDYRRNKCDQLYWVKATFQLIKQNLSDSSDKLNVVLIPDTRFRNELKALKEKGGKYIDIYRLDDANQVFIDPSRDPNHPSEVDLDRIAGDLEIEAMDGDLQYIRDEAKLLAEQIKNGTF